MNKIPRCVLNWWVLVVVWVLHGARCSHSASRSAPSTGSLASVGASVFVAIRTIYCSLLSLLFSACSLDELSQHACLHHAQLWSWTRFVDLFELYNLIVCCWWWWLWMVTYGYQVFLFSLALMFQLCRKNAPLYHHRTGFIRFCFKAINT